MINNFNSKKKNNNLFKCKYHDIQSTKFFSVNTNFVKNSKLNDFSILFEKFKQLQLFVYELQQYNKIDLVKNWY